MGYACPVCEDPQADATHLANHLAFTAILRGGTHQAWLDETVPEWDELDADSLGQSLADHVEKVEYPQVFEADEPDSLSGIDRREGIADGLDEEAREALADAADLTRKRRTDSETE